MSEQKWTTTAPITPGWYWAATKAPDSQRIVEVWESDGELLIDEVFYGHIAKAFARWLGPLDVPDLPSVEDVAA